MARSSAISSTAIEASFSLLLVPSVSMVLQKGQAAAIMLGWVSSACSVRSRFTSFFPFSDSLQGSGINFLKVSESLLAENNYQLDLEAGNDTNLGAYLIR